METLQHTPLFYPLRHFGDQREDKGFPLHPQLLSLKTFPADSSNLLPALTKGWWVNLSERELSECEVGQFC